jgi:DNA invertase Pin-like site-specific DNA recombinase
MQSERGKAMCVIYGYARVSTQKQNIERQIRNIKAVYPTAVILQDSYTGTTITGRKNFENLVKKIQPGDTIVFDSVSRMSRNADEGFQLYKDLFTRGVSLVFLKEPHIDTTTYKQAMENQLQIAIDSGDSATDELMQSIINALNTYVLALAQKQIVLAFEQSEKEVTDLRQRTREGIETARLAGKQIGAVAGKKRTTKKSIQMKDKIRQMSKKFDGNMNDGQVIEILHLARNTYYKYVKEMLVDETTEK